MDQFLTYSFLLSQDILGRVPLADMPKLIESMGIDGKPQFGFEAVRSLSNAVQIFGFPEPHKSYDCRIKQNLTFRGRPISWAVSAPLIRKSLKDTESLSIHICRPKMECSQCAYPQISGALNRRMQNRV
jgi:hypothetical protein